MATRARPSPSPRAAAKEDDVLRGILGELQALNRSVAAIASRLAAQAEGDMDPGRPIDPGDSVPEGVAPQEPAPLTSEDKKVRRALERLPRRPRTTRGRGSDE
jgi:hypothetical protein